MDTQNRKTELLKYYAEWKKPDTKSILHDFVSTKFQNRENNMAGKIQNSGLVGVGLAKFDQEKHKTSPWA